MVFSHPFFVYFFAAVLFALYFFVKSGTARRTILIAFSLIFYAWGEPIYVFLMIFTVAVNYFFGLFAGNIRGNGRNGGLAKRTRKIFLILAVVVDLLILSYFKYTGFLIETINGLTGASIIVPGIIMPIGISFFTFQAMSYVIDVYRGDSEVQRSFPKLLLYISLFPQLIAGPIVRYKDIEEQLDNLRIKPYMINEGIFRFALGAAKKILIADSCYAAVQSFYQTSGGITFVGRWMGAIFFALQIYYDFSGYSDMAIGLGKILGLRFNENFNYPYAADSATEFWRRWHISLGTFFRDYVYIPLGGNRRFHIRNILIVWFLTGLWHGASWNFVIWGLFYGILLIFEKKFFLKFTKSLNTFPRVIITRIYTAFITVFGFAIFYFEKDTAASLGYLFGIGVSSFNNLITSSLITQNLFLLIAGVVLSFPVVPKLLGMLERRFGAFSYALKRYTMLAISLILLFLSTIQMIGDTYSPFLYWNF